MASTHQRLVDRFGEKAEDALYAFVAAALAIVVSGFALIGGLLTTVKAIDEPD